MIPTRAQALSEPAGKQMDAWIAKYILHDPFIAPGHGPCCTCQVCGHGYNECVCGSSEDIGMVWKIFLIILDPNRTSLHPCGNGADGLWWAIYHDDEMIAWAPTVELVICRAALLGVMEE